MAEIWGAAIMVGGAVISGMAADKKDKGDKRHAQAMSKDEAKYQGILNQLDQETQYYYRQVDKQEKMRGLAEFKKFSGMQRINPAYASDNAGPVLPDKPNVDDAFNSTVSGNKPTTVIPAGTESGRMGGGK